jgi:fused signal recognition particle receptor
MLSFFRRKKPQDTHQADKPLSADELAAAFPQAPSATDPASASAAEAPPASAATTPATPVEHLAADIADATGEAQPVAALPLATTPIEAAPQATAALVQPIEPAAAAPQVVVPGTEQAAPPAAAVATAPAVVTPDAARSATPQPGAATTVVEPSADPLVVTDKPAAPAGKSGWRERLRGSVFARSFGGLFSRNPKLDDDLLDEIETALITADVGVPATTALVEGLRKRMKAREFADAAALLSALRAELIGLLQPVAKPLVIDREARPFVVLTVGVNGVGKTTTIGKLAKRFKDEGHGLMLAAGDTFRAAAVAQLQAWGQRNGVAVVAQGQNADAASVAFDALQAGKARGTDVLIADTAGRLHTQVGLMNELGKIRRVLGKVDPSAPHEVLMVIDGTTGQNALSQLRQFHAAVTVTGLVVTKLDGTAKGGVVFALAREFGIPIRFAGIGERPEDLRVFDPDAFVDALLPEALGA